MNDVCAAALLADSGAATPSMAPLPNLSGVLEMPLLQAVRREARQHVPAAGEDAEQRTHGGAAQDRHPDAPEVVLGEPEPLHLLGHEDGVVALLEVADDLGDAEQADGQGHEVQAAVELADPEREPGNGGELVLADGAEQQPEHDHGERLDRRPAGQGNGGQEAQDHDGEVVRRTELQRGRREWRSEQRHCHGGHGAGEEGAEGGSGQGGSRSSLLGHLVAVQRGHDRGGLSRQVEQDRCGRPAVLGAVVDAGQHDQRGDGVELEGDRQQKSHRGGRPDAGEHADGGPEGDAEQADQDVGGLQGCLEAEEDAVHVSLRASRR